MGKRVLEEKKRFSKSHLWTLQNNAYKELGPSSWTKGLVPSYITSNPFTAKKYAELAVAYLRDNREKIDPKEPVYLFDLGAGSGRFAFLFLKAFKRLLPEDLCFNYRYVLTDIAESTLFYLQNQSCLKPFEGIDFAYYHHEQEEKLILLKSGEVIEKIQNPMILIANYFFDTIPQELFRIKGGELEEGRLTLTTANEELERDDPRLIPDLECHYDYVPFEPSHYSAKVVEVLKGYCALKEATFLFPTGGVQSLHYFEALSEKGFLLLAGDQGVSTEEQILSWGAPKITKHTTFSIAVNYHSLAAYFQKNRGMALLTSFPDPIFANIVAVWGAKESPQLKRVFETQFDTFEPKDYFLLVSEKQELSLDSILLLLKLGDFDPINLHYFFPQVLSLIPEATPLQKAHWKLAINSVFDRLYITSKEEGEFVLNLGVLYFEMKEYEKALEYFKRSLEITGENAQTRKNIEACEERIKIN